MDNASSPPLGFASSGGLRPSEVVACISSAESMGYSSAWMAEGHGGDQFAILSAAAMQTSTITLGTCISSVFVRSAPTLAMAALTLDDLSGGRCVLGLGTSHKEQVQPEHGVVFEKPTARLREYIEITRRIAADGKVDGFSGEAVSIEAFDLWYERKRRKLPIYVAGIFPRMLEICGEISDGVLLTRATLANVAEKRAHIEAGARAAGRDPSDVVVASLLPTYVADTQQAAFDAMRPGLAFYAGFFPRYKRLLAEAGFADAADNIAQAWNAGHHQQAAALVPDKLIDTTCIAGTAEQCHARVAEYRAAGIDLPIIGVRTPLPDQVTTVLAACAGA
jgi:alkanesulfonate monooxygenase SsuD/methylene tetrahydromethanopterin reductase-like flavin-dependent oxidoreductase (luciferase family)